MTELEREMEIAERAERHRREMERISMLEISKVIQNSLLGGVFAVRKRMGKKETHFWESERWTCDWIWMILRVMKILCSLLKHPPLLPHVCMSSELHIFWCFRKKAR